MIRDYEVLKQQYDQLLANREQVRLRSDVQTRTSPLTIQVVEPPSIPGVPAAPNRPVFLSLILIIGIGAGIAVAFVKGQLQTTFPTQNRLAALTGLPVFGTLSEVVTPPERLRRRQQLLWLGGAGAALAGSYAILILIEFWQRSRWREERHEAQPHLAGRTRRRSLRFRGALRGRDRPGHRSAAPAAAIPS